VSAIVRLVAGEELVGVGLVLLYGAWQIVLVVLIVG